MKIKFLKFTSLILAVLVLSTVLAPIAQASEVNKSCSSCVELSTPKPPATSGELMPIIYGVWLAEVTKEYTDIHLWYKLLPAVSSLNNNNGNLTGDGTSTYTWDYK